MSAESGLFAQELHDSSEQLYRSTIIFSAAVTFVGFLIAVSFSLILNAAITKPILAAVDVADQYATGDFTSGMDPVFRERSDEGGLLARAFESMKNNLVHMIMESSRVSQNVAATAEELSAAAEESSSASIEIATTINEVAAATNDQA